MDKKILIILAIVAVIIIAGVLIWSNTVQESPMVEEQTPSQEEWDNQGVVEPFVEGDLSEGEMLETGIESEEPAMPEEGGEPTTP